MNDFFREVRRHWSDGRALMQFRHYRKWKRSLHPDSCSVNDRMPWITFDAMEILETHLTKTSVVFEFGAGGSTLYFLDHAGKVFSVEHDPHWMNLLKQKVSYEDKKRWTPLLCEPVPIEGGTRYTPADPEGYLSSDEPNLGKSFETYATSIAQCDVPAFDAVLVDGRARPSCIVHSLERIRSGGLLIVDNAERKYYLDKTLTIILRDYEPILQTFGSIPYNPTFTKTAIWKKR